MSENILLIVLVLCVILCCINLIVLLLKIKNKHSNKFIKFNGSPGISLGISNIEIIKEIEGEDKIEITMTSGATNVFNNGQYAKIMEELDAIGLVA